MFEASPTLRLFGAVLIGLWLTATVVAILAARRRAPGAAIDIPRKTRPPPSPDALSPAVFNLSTLPIWWVDRDLVLAGANDAYARAVGHADGNAAIRARADLAPGSRTLTAQARDTQRAIVGDERVTIDGERRLLEIIAIPLRGGEVAHLALDETRRHAAHTAAAARARALADTLDDLATAVAWFDATTALAHHNRCFAETFALDRGWLETRPEFGRVLEAMRTARRLPEVSDFAEWRARCAAWFGTDQSASENWTLPGGTLLHMKARARDGGVLLLFENGTEHAHLAAARDRLLEVHATTLDHLREGVAVFGPDGKLKLFNRRFAEIAVASPETLAADLSADRLMEHVAGLMSEPERARDLRTIIVDATAGRTARRGQFTSKLGFTIEWSAVPLPDGDALFTFNAMREQGCAEGGPPPGDRTAPAP